MVVDDVGFFEKIKAGRRRTDRGRLAEIDGAYNDAGLAAKMSKRHRELRKAQIWGAEVDGDRGWVAAPRAFILRLLWLTCKMTRCRTTRLGLIRPVLGLWAYVLIFRRCGLSLFSAVYKDIEKARSRWRWTSGLLSEEPPADTEVRLSKGACGELLAVVLCAASWGSSHRAEFPSRVFASRRPKKPSASSAPCPPREQ